MSWDGGRTVTENVGRKNNLSPGHYPYAIVEERVWGERHNNVQMRFFQQEKGRFPSLRVHKTDGDSFEQAVTFSEWRGACRAMGHASPT